MLLLSYVHTSIAFDQSQWITALYKTNRTILFKDLTYPGAHDAITADLSTDIPYYEDIGSLLRVWPIRQLSSIVAGSVIRSFSQTQLINITSMLNGGIRLLDLRATIKDRIYDEHCLDGEWRGYHGVVTNKPFREYIKEVSSWIHLPQYRSEIVLVMISYHGDNECVSNCWNSIPSVCVQRLFSDTVEILGRDILFNQTSHNISTVNIGDLVDSGQRIILLWSGTDSLTQTHDRDFAVDQASATCQDSCNPTLNTGSLKNISDKVISLDTSFRRIAKHVSNNKLSIMGLENSILPCIAKVGAVRAIDRNYCNGAKHSNIINTGWCLSCENCFNMPSNLQGCPWVTMTSNAAIVNYYTQRSLDNVVRYPDHYRFPSILYQDMLDFNGRVIVDPYQYNISTPYVETIVLYNFLRHSPKHALTRVLREKYYNSSPIRNLPSSPRDGIYPQNGPNSWPISNKCSVG